MYDYWVLGPLGCRVGFKVKDSEVWALGLALVFVI